MSDGASSMLGPWANFYVIAGSAAAGLTGLMFVVIALVADRDRPPGSEAGIAAYSTPTVVHFCVALLVSATLTVPWSSLVHASVVLGLAGLGGFGYTLRVTLLATRQTAYEPDRGDWMWYTVLPLIAYLDVVGCAIVLAARPGAALLVLGAGVLLLIFIGIHNSWDVVTFIASGKLEEQTKAARAKDARAKDARR
jgi:hypothetical protein